ncbi:MAG: Ig-like domain-containing protein [bacterium]|nr:Ig-like domain-containing protein [bacterium]
MFNFNRHFSLKSKTRLILSLILVIVCLWSINQLFFKADEIGHPSILLPVNNSYLTYVNNPLIQGTATAGANLSVLDNDTAIGSITTEASGHFYYKPTAGFTEGVHKLQVRDNTLGLNSDAIYIKINTADPGKAILKAQGTQIIENDHPYYGNGINQYNAIVKMMGDPAGVEADFAKAEKAGVKMVRIINYTLDDMVLPNPTSAPTAIVGSGGTMAAGNYVYRYTCANLSKDVFAYNTAETLPSPATSSIAVGSGQKVTLSLAPCAKSYRYEVYRRLASGASNTEAFLGEASQIAGQQATYTDDGSKTPSHGLPASNQTQNNPRSTWPTNQSKAFMTGFGNWNEDALVASDKTMALAKKYNIRILFTFIDQHDNNTGGVRDIARNCAVGNSEFFANDCSKNMNKEIISKFLNRTNTITGINYKDDPAIFSWELINEPWETNGGNGFRWWINEIGGYLKTIDSKHMLSSGDDGSVWFTHNEEAAYNTNNAHDFVLDGTPSVIDLLTFHGYPESNGFVFNHGSYGTFTPTAEWLDKWGPVSGPIDIAGSIKEMQRRAHYANLLNKPVVFGEWGLNQSPENNWLKPEANDWINGISNAILTIKPDLVRGNDAFSDGNFSRPISDTWNVGDYTASLAIDNTVTNNNHPTLKITTKADPRGGSASRVSSKIFPIKPNTKYWYEFTGKNPSSRTLEFNLQYYNGSVAKDLIWGYGGSIASGTNSWRTLTRFDNSLCEFTTPADVDGAVILLNMINGIPGDTAWIGQLRLYELTEPTASNNSTFASTGWWGVDLDYSMDALAMAARNFEIASYAGLPPISPPTPDTTAPTTAITTPTNNASVSSTATIMASASDAVGVTKVEFYENNNLISSKTTSPFSVTWDTTKVTNGSHVLNTKAYDGANNVGTSPTVAVTVANTTNPTDTTPPTVSITSPLNNATITIRTKINITASATDNVQVTKVEFYINGSLKTTNTISPYSYSWNTRGKRISAGTYTIIAKAYDAAGNVGQKSIVVTLTK